MEQDGIIQRRVAILDAEKVGLPVSVFVAVETADHSSEWLGRFAQVIRDTPEIVDAWRMSGDVDYLMHVVSAEDEWWERTRSKDRRWKVIVVEDADELIRADAGRTSGPSLGRLLNLTDGILGHGMRILLLITTNEPVRALHPAVVRPGRCLADVRFRPFTRHEATEWLHGHSRLPEGDLTLAELYRIRDGLDSFANNRPQLTGGLYL